MNQENYVFTSESVSEGHPDKVCDQLSDAILDHCLTSDPDSRVACEALAKNQNIILGGEITSSATLDYHKIVKDVITQIGYTDPGLGFDAENFKLDTYICQQSPDISIGVTEGEGSFKEQGAGDQGIMFGFACDETEELMPLPISLAHKLVEELASQRKAQVVPFLRPDSKSQVTIRYENGKPAAADTVVISTQHTEDVTREELESYVIESVIKKVVPHNLLTDATRYFINPTGRFVTGGPVGDAGLTGRKIIVDTYGGYSRHGGGCFSGKDPSKVDRSAAYAARHIAKNIVAAGVATKCEVQLAYAIGVAEPVSVFIETFGTGKVSEERISAAVKNHFNLTPRGIIEHLDLKHPIYLSTAAYGHMGREASSEGHFSWEKTDKAQMLKAELA